MDQRGITIEVANSSTGGEWPVSQKAYDKLIDLCVDICKRNGIPKLNFTGDRAGNLVMHKYYANTQCPGPYLEKKFPDIAAEVNARLGAAVEEKPAEQVQEKVEAPVKCDLPELYKGCKGKSVRALQILLIGNGCSCGSYGADGDFGSATKAAVVKYQNQNGLEDDGVVGPKTWAKLLGLG